MSVCTIDAIVSLPKFAFAPYTKEKTYAIFLTKKHNRNYGGGVIENRATGKFQTTPIWMYIIDNDGYANSDKRFPTRLRNDNQQWLHDEVSGYSDNNGVEHKSLLVQRWMNYDDSLSYGTEWMTDRGKTVKLRKGGFIQFDEITSDTYYTLLPEKYLRRYEPNFVDEARFVEEFSHIESSIKKLSTVSKRAEAVKVHVDRRYQVENIKISSCIGYVSGNSGLTEEFLYNNIKLPGERYTILSSATLEENMLGEIPMCKIEGHDLKVFENKPGLLVIRKGKAGTTQFLKPGRYTLNDDAYILFVKEDCPYEIDLKWLALRYKMEFLNYASSSDNGTWNMTGFFKNVVIDIPVMEEQQRMVKMYADAEALHQSISEVQLKLRDLLNKEIQV